MKRKTKIIVYTTCIILTLLILLGFTYGYYLTKINGNKNSKSLEITSGDSSLLYTDLSTEDTSEIIEPGYTNIKLFTIKNIGDLPARYDIYLTDVSNSFSRKQDLTYTLYRKVGNNTIDTSDMSDCEVLLENVEYPSKMTKIKANEVIANTNDYYTYALKITYINHPTENQNIDQGKKFTGKIQIGATGEDMANPYSEGSFAYTLITNAKNATGDKSIYQETPTTSPGNAISTYKYITTNGSGIEKNASTMSVSSTYQAYYWIYGTGYTVNESTGYFTLTGVNSLSSSSKTYANMYSDLVGKYLISSSASGNSVADTSTANPKTTSNISSIYKVTAATSSQITYKQILPQTVGTEKTLSKSEDDYGDSYYYRGKVVDNYVNFAGMCWRIVRIQGDRSLKLILEDQNTTCDSATYTGNWNLVNANFGYDSSTYSGKDVINYLNPITSVSSALVNKFKTFQTGTLTTKISSTYSGKGLSDYLKAGDWCYDDTAYSSSSSISGTPLTEEQKINYYKGTTSGNFYYDSYIRLYGQSTKTPTNKCNGTILNKYNDNTDMYVSTLTADEIVYAGGKVSASNYGYYLLNDYQRINSNYWWCLSPYYWNGSNSYSFYVYYHGRLNYDFVDNYRGSRPAVSLKSSTSISGGDGTKNNPYTVG